MLDLFYFPSTHFTIQVSNQAQTNQTHINISSSNIRAYGKVWNQPFNRCFLDECSKKGNDRNMWKGWVETVLPEGGSGKVVKIHLTVLAAVIVSSHSSPFAFAFSSLNCRGTQHLLFA